MPAELTLGEASTWRLIQRLSELASNVVEHQIRSAADLSAAEFDVLRCLIDAPGGQLRQADVAAQLGWDKSRLSHQLTRMGHRGLVERQKAGRMHGVVVTREGRQKFDLADGAHVVAVRLLLREHLSTAEREALQRTARLAAADAVEPVAPARTPRLRPRIS